MKNKIALMIQAVIVQTLGALIVDFLHFYIVGVLLLQVTNIAMMMQLRTLLIPVILNQALPFSEQLLVYYRICISYL